MEEIQKLLDAHQKATELMKVAQSIIRKQRITLEELLAEKDQLISENTKLRNHANEHGYSDSNIINRP